MVKRLYVDIDQSHWISNEHFDIAERILKDLRFCEEETNVGLKESHRTSAYFSDCAASFHWVNGLLDSFFLSICIWRSRAWMALGSTWISLRHLRIRAPLLPTPTLTKEKRFPLNCIYRTKISLGLEGTTGDSSKFSALKENKTQ